MHLFQSKLCISHYFGIEMLNINNARKTFETQMQILQEKNCVTLFSDFLIQIFIPFRKQNVAYIAISWKFDAIECMQSNQAAQNRQKASFGLVLSECEHTRKRKLRTEAYGFAHMHIVSVCVW